MLSLNKSFGFDLGFLFVLQTHKKSLLISFAVLFPRRLFLNSLFKQIYVIQTGVIKNVSIFLEFLMNIN